jgi:hypothetical protein
LHKADLANGSDGIRIVRAFHLRDRIGYFRRKAALLSFVSNEPHMCEAAARVQLR